MKRKEYPRGGKKRGKRAPVGRSSNQRKPGGNNGKKEAKGKDVKSKGTCFHCKKDGHWKRNCPDYLAEVKAKKEGNVPLTNINVIETNVVELSSSVWIVDSGVTNNVCYSLQQLSKFRMLEVGEFELKVGNGETVSAKAVG